MQIHEITKLKKLEEGLLDTVKAVAKGVGQELAQRHLGAKPATQQPTTTDDVLKSRGINTFEKMLQYVQANTQTNRAIQNIVPEFISKFVNVQAEPKADEGPMPSPGKVIQVINPKTGGKYFRDETGTWYNELGQPVVDPKAINSLIKMADATGREIPAKVNKPLSGKLVKEVAPQVLRPNPARATTPVQPAATATGTPAVRQSSVTANPEIDKWVQGKVKGFNPAKVAPEAKAKLDSSNKELLTAIASGNNIQVATALTNYLLVAKAAAMFTVQRQKEINAKQQRAETGDIGDWEDADGDGLPDLPANTNPQVNKLNQILQTQGVAAFKNPNVVNALKTTGVLK